MIGWTLCSGIGAPEVAAPWVDWRLAAEIEPFPRAVLEQKLGYKAEDHNQGDPLLWDDMTEVTPELAHSRGVPLPDLLVAGTPCQAFSIAGLRGGTDDARGNLTLKFVETCHAIVDARPDGKLAVLWENVPGVLSDKGNAFGCFMGGLVGSVDPLQPPGDGTWPREGMVQGPRARLAWSVLDAQWFGVAQRRRRVFVVVDFGNCIDPGAVLLEPDSLRGDTPPSREAGESIAGTLSARTKGGGGLGSDMEIDGGLVVNDWPADVAPTLNAHYGDKMGLENQHALNGAGLFVPVAFSAMPMNSGKDFVVRETDIAQPLMAGGPVGGNQGGDYVAQAVCFDPNQITSKVNRSIPTPEICHTIPNVSIPPILFNPQVRRLMPIECARLQGFPDDHTEIEWRGKPPEKTPEGIQYKAYGNSMAVPCVKWILDRMKISMEIDKKRL